MIQHAGHAVEQMLRQLEWAGLVHQQPGHEVIAQYPREKARDREFREYPPPSQSMTRTLNIRLENAKRENHPVR